MISLKTHRTQLVNLAVTIEALDDLDRLIKEYSNRYVGPAYLSVRHGSADGINFQMDRTIIVPALQAQRQHIVDYLAGLGIAVDEPDVAETQQSEQD